MWHIWGIEGLVGKTKRDYLECIGVEERIILRWIFRKWDLRAWTGSSTLWLGTGGRQLWMC